MENLWDVKIAIFLEFTTKKTSVCQICRVWCCCSYYSFHYFGIFHLLHYPIFVQLLYFFSSQEAVKGVEDTVQILFNQTTLRYIYYIMYNIYCIEFLNIWIPSFQSRSL